MSGWTKLFSSIVTSSIWVEDDATVRVWVAMLATADSDGIVEGSVPGFASLARVTEEQMERAVEILSSPDKRSRTPDHEGRRIESVPGGWRILNYGEYRARAQGKGAGRAPYHRQYRAKKKAEAEAQLAQQIAQQQTVARNTEGEEEGEAERTTEVELPSVGPRDIEQVLDRMAGDGHSLQEGKFPRRRGGE